MSRKQNIIITSAVLLCLPGPGGPTALQSSQAETIQALQVGGFALTKEVVLPGTPGEIFDAMTGDVQPWWDHTFSESPRKLYIEARPGGGFYEIFDEEGNGALHATVITANRGELLRFTGPLGLAGSALEMVHTFTFEAEGENTRVKLRLHAVGELPEGIPQTVSAVWDHFLVERLKPYVESGRHRTRATGPNAKP